MMKLEQYFFIAQAPAGSLRRGSLEENYWAKYQQIFEHFRVFLIVVSCTHE